MNNNKVQAIVEKVKELVQRGNVSRIVVRKGERVLLNIPVNVGIVGGVVAVASAKWVLLASILATVGFGCSVEVVKEDGNIVNVNQMPDSSFLYNTDIADLAGAESFHDTQTVQVTGEVVGDHINDELDSNLCWITLQSTKADDYSLVSVLMTNEQAKLIENYGNYNTDGTILQVRGTFYLSCSEHQGLSDIHAKEVTVVKQGSPRKHPVNDAVLWTSCLAVGLGVLSLFTYSFLRERRK